MKKLNVVLCGLKFGASFVPIYRDHPDVESVGIFDTDEKTMKEVSEHYHIEKMYHSFDEVLNDDKVDAVHLITPIPLHAQQSVQVLKSGKHCACTVPMGVTLEELESIIQAEKESGKKYMMMETTLYTRQFLYTKKLYENGEMGRIQFMRCAHYQDMEGWPSYWDGFPPLAHPTHALWKSCDRSDDRHYRFAHPASDLLRLRHDERRSGQTVSESLPRRKRSVCVPEWSEG